jgi:hypothetical protein
MRFARIALIAGSTLLAMHPASARTKTFLNSDLKYAIDLPAACRHVEGPGTLEAVCSVDLDPERSAKIAAAGAFLLEIDAEAVPADAKVYGQAEFRQELPEAVCGESDGNKVKITGIAETRDGARTTFKADVVCPEMRFLALPERRAEVRYVIAAGARYRMMARVPADDVPATKPAADAFFASFRILN